MVNGLVRQQKGREMKKFSVFLIGMLSISLILLFYSNVYSATIFFDEDDYNAAVGSELFFINFDGSTPSLVSGDGFSSNVTFSSPRHTNPAQIFWNIDAITDAGITMDTISVGPIAGDFTTSVYAFGFDFFSGRISSVDLFDSDSILIGSVSAQDQRAPGFIGVVSDTRIDSFLLLNRIFPEVGRDSFFYR